MVKNGRGVRLWGSRVRGHVQAAVNWFRVDLLSEVDVMNDLDFVLPRLLVRHFWFG